MKKILSLLIMLTLLFSVSGCKKDETPTDKENNNTGETTNKDNEENKDGIIIINPDGSVSTEDKTPIQNNENITQNNNLKPIQ